MREEGGKEGGKEGGGERREIQLSKRARPEVNKKKKHHSSFDFCKELEVSGRGSCFQGFWELGSEDSEGLNLRNPFL